MRYTLRHTIHTDVDSFWEMFFSEEYNEAMFKGALGFSEWRVLDFHRGDDGVITRRTHNVPKVDYPAAMKKVVGDLSSYVEEGRFDPVKKRWIVDVTPSAMADKIKTHVEQWVEPRGDKSCERIAEIDNSIKVFGLGGMMEKFFEQQMRTSYDQSADFTNKWIADKGL